MNNVKTTKNQLLIREIFIYNFTDVNYSLFCVFAQSQQHTRGDVNCIKNALPKKRSYITIQPQKQSAKVNIHNNQHLHHLILLQCVQQWHHQPIHPIEIQ